MDSYTARKPSFRNLQPRSAAAMDFNDSDDDELGDQLSADYKAQRKTTLDLVDFFKNAPPPPSPPRLPPMMVDEKKKRTLLQRLRSRKSGSGMGGASAPLGKDRENRRLGTGSTISTASNYTVGKGGEVATLPNGKKYIMIAVDYKRDQDADGAPAVVKRTSGSSSKRMSRIGIEENLSSRRQSVLNTPAIHVTTTIQEDSGVHGSSLGINHDGDKRRSIVIQAGGGEGASFILDNTPFLLDNFALDTDFIVAPPTSMQTQTHSTSSTAMGDPRRARQLSNNAMGTTGAVTQGQREAHSTTSERADSATKRLNKVQFNIKETPQPQECEQPLDEDALSEALSRRIATHKANMAKNKAMLATSDTTTAAAGAEKDTHVSQLEIVLPKPVARKKVRHVQIQTQHCIMRPMCTQTEPMESLIQDLEIKEFGTQTMGSSGSVCGSSTDCGTSTDFESTVTSSSWSSKPTVNRANSKVASLVASLSHPTSTSTSTSTKTGSQASNVTSSTLTVSEQEELVQLRQQRAALQVQVASLQRDLAAETRARTRTAVAMQDTRDKFELLSAMAYKKIKEMIFQRHVLEMEVRELRAQVDLQAEDGAESYQQRLYQQQLHQHQHQQQHQQQQEHQDYISVGRH
ncbi:hypothetical protein BGZ70_006975 [Mortierella alpina]|uniref:Uncharacterized protein n=1 Tax=Mortierella alpina TaxID=64518 RepID=A0A9P6JE20_MORAP|nr:hypothetical protein BGZ70_006975 [Mortierella alpina]